MIDEKVKQREIKFRAWVKKGNSAQSYTGMYPVFGLSKDICTVIRSSTLAPTMFSLDEVEIMQFTGLLDRDGKEIYEGDVVSLVLIEDSARNWKTDAKAVVEWDSDDAGFYYFTTYDRFPHAKPWYTEKVEVIGNIYEHPELKGEV